MGNKETKSQEILVIKDITEKEGKTGRKFFSVTTDKGPYSVFEYDVVDELKMHRGDKGEFETAQRDNFHNIRKVIQWIETGKPVQNKPTENKPVQTESLSSVQAAKDTSIYTSYAKDIFCEMFVIGQEKAASETMKEAIDLVLQAKNSFK